jgi:Mg2+ and Co2+ transporter CorA
VAATWRDLVDPTLEELVAGLPVAVEPETLEALVAPPGDGRTLRPRIESHGEYVLAVLATPVSRPAEDRVDYLEIDGVATMDGLVTIRRTGPGGATADVSVLAAAPAGTSAGALVHLLVDDVTDTFLDLLDALYGEVDELEDNVEQLTGPVVRRRLVELRHELLHARRTISATRAAVRRIVDRRCELSTGELFPRRIEAAFADTYDTLVRATEDLDVARELVGGVRDFYQAKVTESQNDTAKTLTVIASLVLVPSLIVGFYGQNFESAFTSDLWTLGVSSSLILASTLVQLALYRWRRWI